MNVFNDCVSLCSKIWLDEEGYIVLKCCLTFRPSTRWPEKNLTDRRQATATTQSCILLMFTAVDSDKFHKIKFFLD